MQEVSEISRSASSESSVLSNTFNKLPSSRHSRKRKWKDDEDDRREAGVVKSVQSKRSKKFKSDEDCNLDLSRGLNLAIAKLDSKLAADYANNRTKRLFSDLSLVELEDRYISEFAFHDATSWEKPRTLEYMPSFLEYYNSKTGGKMALSSAAQKPGNPHTLVITLAGIRAADISRALRIFQTKESAVAKLFAKHIKLREAVEYLKKTRIGIGVGTPSRIIDLLELGALALSSLEQVVIDCSHIDQKKRGIFDMRETLEPLMALLNQSDLKPRYGNGSGKVRLLLY